MFSKTFALENYFMHVPEMWLDEGRDLLNTIRPVPGDKKGFWVFRWQDQAEVETEVLVGRKYVKAYSCDCAGFQERKMCPHIAGALHYVFQVVTEEQQHKNLIKSRERIQAPRIQIKNIVSQLSEKELKRFLINQASRNPLLSGELKALFAHKIEVPDDQEKYFFVIKNYLSALSQGRLSESKFNKLSSYLINLIRHGEDLCSEKNYREAALILLGLLKFLGTTIIRFRSFPWESLSLEIHLFLVKIFEENLPPAFRIEFVGKLRKIYEDDAYVILDDQYNLFSILYDKIKDQRESIYFDLIRHAETRFDTDSGLCTLFSLAIYQRDISALREMIIRNVQNLAVLRRLIEIAKTRAELPVTKILVNHIRCESKGPKIRKWAFDQLVAFESDQDKIRKIYGDFIIAESRSDLLPELRSLSGDQWPIILQDLATSLDDGKHDNILLDVLVMNDDLEKVITLLNKNDDSGLLLEHADYLHRKNRKYLIQGLENAIARHLSDHIGYQSADYIMHVFTRLGRLKLDSVIEELYRFILRKFPERTYLIKYLKESAV